MLKKKYHILIIMLFSIKLFSQSYQYPFEESYYHKLDRFMIKYSGSINDIHSSLKYYNVDDINEFLLNLNYDELDEKSKKDFQYLLLENIDWLIYKDSSYLKNKAIIETNAFQKGIRNIFYKSKSSFAKLSKKHFFIKANPVIRLSLDRDIANDNYIFINTRGFKIGGLLDNKIYFYSSLYETQRNYPEHIERKIKRDQALPGEGFFKPYKSGIIKSVEGYDFLNAQAYAGIKLSKHLNMQLGHGRFFIGNGIRSLLLSDYAHNYFYLKFDTRIWKFHYQNIFAELTAESRGINGKDRLLPKKYMAAHYLNFKFNKNLQAGIFENVIFHRKDHFEFQYLNPVIIYRTVEQFTGSADNVLVGMDINYNFLNRFSLYGQLLLDEFNFAILKKNDGWWANKYGLQLGFKYIDMLGIDHLDLQVESNIVRPYTYSHSDSIATYSHYNQALAHPLGANFKELIILMRYMPHNRIFLKSKILFAMKGEDNGKISYGGNILRSYDLRPHDTDGNTIDYGYYIGTGMKHNITQYSLEASYMFYPGYFMDFEVLYRKDTYDNSELDFDEFYIGTGIRVNIEKRNQDF